MPTLGSITKSIVVAMGLDMTAYARAAKEKVAADRAMGQSSQEVERETNELAAAATKTGGSFKRLVASIDPAIRSEIQMQQKMAALNRELEKGNLTTQQHALLVQRLAAQKSAAVKDVDRYAGAFSRLSGAGGTLVGILGKIGIGISGFALFNQARETIQWGDALADTATRLGVTAEELQVFRIALREAGGEMMAADAGLQALNKAMGLMIAGVGDERIKKFFDELGISREQLESLGTAEKLLPVLADKISQLGTRAEQIAFAEKLGLEGLIPLLQLTGAEIEALTGSIRESGEVASNETVGKLERLNSMFERLWGTVKVVSAEIVVGFVDALERPLPSIATAITYIEDYNASLARTAGLLQIIGVAQASAFGGAVSRGAGSYFNGLKSETTQYKESGRELFAVDKNGNPIGINVPEVERGSAGGVRALTEAQRDYNDVIAFITPQLSAVAEMEMKIARARAAGLLSGGQYLAAISTNVAGSIGGIVAETAGNTPRAIKPGVTPDNSLFAGIRDEFIEGMRSLPAIVAGGFDNIESAFKQWLGNMLQAMADMLAQRAGDSLASVGASIISGLFADGAAFNRGRVVAFASGGVVDGPTMFPMAGGRMGLMGERGPEAVMPLERGPGGRLGVRASGGGQSVNIVNNNDFRGASAEIIPVVRAMQEQTKAEMLAAIRDLGPASVRDSVRRGRTLRRG